MASFETVSCQGKRYDLAMEKVVVQVRDGKSHELRDLTGTGRTLSEAEKDALAQMRPGEVKLHVRTNVQ